MYDKSLTTAKENLPVWKEIAGRSLRIELYFWMFVMTGEHIFKSLPALVHVLNVDAIFKEPKTSLFHQTVTVNGIDFFVFKFIGSK